MYRPRRDVEPGRRGAIARITDEVIPSHHLQQAVPDLGLKDHIDVIVLPPGLQRKAVPGWPPPEALPERGTALPKVLVGYSDKGPCWSRW